MGKSLASKIAASARLLTPIAPQLMHQYGNMRAEEEARATLIKVTGDEGIVAVMDRIYEMEYEQSKSKPWPSVSRVEIYEEATRRAARGDSVEEVVKGVRGWLGAVGMRNLAASLSCI